MLTKTTLGRSHFFVISLFILVLASGFASAAVREDYVGAWLNEDPDTGGITRILIKTSGTKDLEVNAFGKCTPMDCDWGTATAAYSGDPFVVVYPPGVSTKTLTITLLKGNRMHIEAFYDYPPGDPRPDKTVDYYFYLMTKPDFVIREVIQPIGVLEYGVYNWIEFYIQNLGAPYNSGTPLRAKIVNKEKNLVAQATTGYMEPTYFLPIETGEKVYHKFAIGQSSAWSDGDYTFNIMVDADKTIAEEIEDNNLSRTINATIMDDYQVRGFCNYNNYPISWQVSMMPWWQLHNPLPIPGAEFRYYPVSGRYAISGIPETEDVALNASFNAVSDEHRHYPGNFKYARYINLSTLTAAEKEDYTLDFEIIIHMTSPWDNTEILHSSAPMNEHQPGMIFKWDPVPGAAEYNLVVSRYGPSGIIDNQVNIHAPETEQVVALANSNPGEFYVALILARNSSGEIIGQFYRPLTNGYGWDYRFTVNYDCYTLPKLRMFVTKRTSYEVSGTPKYLFKVQITNLDEVPDELFVPAPDLPACGLNTNASRTYVNFYDENDVLRGSYCAVYDKNSLNNLGFSVTQGDPLPKAVKMVLEDRRCGVEHDSIYVDPWYACPIGDLNGDCVVNLADLALMAGTWLDQEDLL